MSEPTTPMRTGKTRQDKMPVDKRPRVRRAEIRATLPTHQRRDPDVNTIIAIGGDKWRL